MAKYYDCINDLRQLRKYIDAVHKLDERCKEQKNEEEQIRELCKAAIKELVKKM